MSRCMMRGDVPDIGWEIWGACSLGGDGVGEASMSGQEAIGPGPALLPLPSDMPFWLLSPWPVMDPPMLPGRII